MKLLVLSAALAVIELAPAHAQNFGVQGNTNLHTNNSVIVSGQTNFVAASNAFIGSGTFNAIQTRGTYSFIGGGSNNVDAGMTNNFAKFSFIGGGANNRISQNAAFSFVGGGVGNAIGTSATRSFIGGGDGNTIGTEAARSFIGGGVSNSVATNASFAYVGGGTLNRVVGSWSVIVGGRANSTLANYSVVMGGQSNSASGQNASVLGGLSNRAQGLYSMVSGGAFNQALGTNAFAAGRGANATNNGAFVWADYEQAATPFPSTAANQFLIRARGGVGINTNNPGTNALLVNGSALIAGNLQVTTINGTTNFSGPVGPPGPKGDTGTQGPAGTPGPQGVAGTKGDTGAQGPAGSIGPTGSQGPAGAKGDTGTRGPTGAPGTAATIAIGDVNTGAAGTSASVTNTGTSNAAVFAFTIPQGPQGDAGPSGPPGPQGVAGAKGDTGAQGPSGPAGQVGPTGTQGPAGAKGDTGAQGPNGAPGTAASIAIGAVNTGAAGTSASVTNTGTSNAAVFAFTIPQGPQGDAGPSGPPGPQGVAGAKGDNGAQGPPGPTGGLNPEINTNGYAYIGGGADNSALGNYSAVSGGYQNTASNFASVGGGLGNFASGETSTIPGGQSNSASGANSFAAGRRAKAVNDGTFVWSDSSETNPFSSSGSNQFLVRAAGGVGINTNNPGANALLVRGRAQISGDLRVTGEIIGNVSVNNVSASNALTIATGGTLAWAAGPQATVNSPTFGTGFSSRNIVAGFSSNSVAAGIIGATISGGGGVEVGFGTGYNQVTANFGTVAGGYGNQAQGEFSFVGGGDQNRATALYATTVGGFNNQAPGSLSFLGGGDRNTANGAKSVIVGGQENMVMDVASEGTIGGGLSNTVAGARGAVGGGYYNEAGGDYSTVPGGSNNLAGGVGSFAAGVRAQANDAYSFVWSGSPAVDTFSFGTGTFTARAPGGVYLITSEAAVVTTNNTNPVLGAYLPRGSTAWSALSDSNVKTDISPVDHRETLRKLAGMPVTAWHYKHDPHRRYIGPMAQDFHATFGLGSDNKHLSTLDTDGVTLSAIKGLLEEINLRDEKIAKLEAWSREQGARSQAEIEELRMKGAELEELKTKLEKLEERLNSLPPAP